MPIGSPHITTVHLTNLNWDYPLWIPESLILPFNKNAADKMQLKSTSRSKIPWLCKIGLILSFLRRKSTNLWDSGDYVPVVKKLIIIKVKELQWFDLKCVCLVTVCPPVENLSTRKFGQILFGRYSGQNRSDFEQHVYCNSTS